MNPKELRTQSPKRLRELLSKAAATVRDLRFTVGTRQQAHVRDLRKAKREFARIKTILREAERSPYAKASGDKTVNASGDKK